MVHVRRLSALCGILALCSLLPTAARATSFTQSGTFTSDNEVLQFDFSTSTTQTYNFYTTSYSGGTNANGTTTSAGGFDPVLSLFNSNGTIYTGEAVSNGGEDANLTDILKPGSYILALTEFPDYSSGTINSFSFGGLAPSTPFFDPVSGTTKTDAYTVNYTAQAVTPEPPSALLLMLPLAGLPLVLRRR